MTSRGSKGALGVLTILDLCESAAGSYAARLLAGYGAQVIKVERPGKGDPLRGDPGTADGSRFLALNAGKMSLALDYETGAGAAILARLLEYSDGIIEDDPTHRREEFGLAAEDLIASVPRLVICKVSTSTLSGLTSPAEPAAQAPGTESLRLPHLGQDQSGADDTAVHSDAEYSHGLHAFVGALGGLWRAAQTEHGQVVEVGNLEARTSTLGEALARGLNGRAAVPEPTAATKGPEVGTLKSEGLVMDVNHPVAGTVPEALGPFVMASTPWDSGSAPLFGEHTEYVLQDIVGLGAAEIESLRFEGLV